MAAASTALRCAALCHAALRCAHLWHAHTKVDYAVGVVNLQHRPANIEGGRGIRVLLVSSSHAHPTIRPASACVACGSKGRGGAAASRVGESG